MKVQGDSEQTIARCTGQEDRESGVGWHPARIEFSSLLNPGGGSTCRGGSVALFVSGVNSRCRDFPSIHLESTVIFGMPH